jgi:hypothetical protein
MEFMRKQQQQPEQMVTTVDELSLIFDVNAYAKSRKYQLKYIPLMFFVIIKVVEENPSITVNQTASLLRNTLEVPDELTKKIIVLIPKSDVVIAQYLRIYATAKGARHLNVVADAETKQQWYDTMIKQYPELATYAAPEYKRGPAFLQGRE